MYIIKTKKIMVIGVILVFAIIGITSYTIFNRSAKGFDITIKNKTNETINGLKITYEGITKDVELPEIRAGQSYKININPEENFSENHMIIYYKDKRRVTQKNTLIGYFEKGYKGKVNVNINSLDKNGLIIMQTQESIY